MNITPTKNIEQAIKHIKALPIQEQQSVFTYIDELIIKYQTKNQQTMVDLINQYPTPTSFNANDIVEMQRRWRDEWE